MRAIHRVAVLGAGTMGSRIAVLFANAGVPVLLLDVVQPGQPDRNAASRSGIDGAASAFFTDSARTLVIPGNFDDDLAAISQCDWIVEAVSERLEVKRALYERAVPHLRDGALVSTNTSGIPLARLADGLPDAFRRSFLGTHFFNPPRFLYLVEVIPGPATATEVLEFVEQFCDERLGKGVVRCKDTPNFIANRLGAFFNNTAQRLMIEEDYSVEEVDAVTGPLIGLPRSACLRLMDLIGLDVWSHLVENLRLPCPGVITELLRRGWIGDKSGQGFYRRTGASRQIEVLDWRTFEYHPLRDVSVDEAMRIRSLPERLRALIARRDRTGTFLWHLLSEYVLYAAACIPEISDRIVEVDRAMRWGYAHTLGPFELWDALGVAETTTRLRDEGRGVPANVGRMLASGATAFYRADGTYFDLTNASYADLEPTPGVIRTRDAAGPVLDLGDGVWCFQIVGPWETQCDALTRTIERARALILYRDGAGFSNSRDFAWLLEACEEHRWKEIDLALRREQQTSLAVQNAAIPIIAAPGGNTLGFGCALALNAMRIQASAELYIGFNECAAGLIPAGGGCSALLHRTGDVHRAIELALSAKVSSSAAHARELGYLCDRDRITMNPHRLLADAKALALEPVPPRATITTQHHASPQEDALVKKLAYVFEGSSEEIFDREREAFLSLCGEQQTQERIRRMLK